MSRPDPRRGEIWWVDWSPGRGSEQTGRRPALIIQTDAANSNPNYPNTIVATVSTKGRNVPSHVRLEPSEDNGLTRTSFIKCEQLLTVSKARLERRSGHLPDEEMTLVEAAIARVLALPGPASNQ